LDALIDDTPTTPEFYILKAQIYKHGGDHKTAYKWMDQARVLDKADRYLNTKCCRYALRAGEIEKAEETVALFLRDGDELTGLQTLQVMWYETNKGMAHLKLGHLGQAIKEFVNIADHFTQISHDQLDFHNYAVRKLTFRTYLSMLKWQDGLRDHPFFRVAAKGAVDAYLQIHEQRLALLEGQPPPKNNEYRYKRSKPPPRVDNKPDNWDEKPKPKEDLDPWGTKLFGTPSPLDECLRLFVAPFEAHAGAKCMLSNMLLARLHLATGKLVLVSKALVQARILDPDFPLVLWLTSCLFHKTEGPNNDKVPKMVRLLVGKFKPKLLDCGSINEHINGVLKRHENSLSHLVAVYRSIKLLGHESPEPIAELFAASVAHCQLADAEQAAETLSESSAKEAFLAECRKRFPLAVFCKPTVE
jgi:peptide alpha-N-acetyltransferase